MNMEFHLGAYWGARRESIEQCADRLRRMFSDLSTCDKAIAAWYEKGRSRKQALERCADVGNREYLLSLLNDGRNRRDTDKSMIEELGFHVTLWNGAADESSADVSITCGMYTSNPNLGNCVTLNLPEDLGDLRQTERMGAVLASVATVWEPDWAGVMSTDAMNARDFDARVPFVDWMFYLSDRVVSQMPPLPPPTIVRQVTAIGSLVVVQSEPPDPTNPEHLRNIERVEAALMRVLGVPC